MNSKRILYVGDFSGLPTGYGQYSRQLLAGLSKHHEVAELACYLSDDDERANNYEWKIFPNKPSDPEDLRRYHSNPASDLGAFRFNSVALKWKPDIVIDIRDPWCFEFQISSPLRGYFSHLLMPTVDAAPNAADWLDYYSQADGLLTYSEFGRDTILKQRNIPNINVASPVASPLCRPLSMEERNKLRADNHLPLNSVIIGTVMRNQPRKLYNDLFDAFSRYIKESKDTTTYLYCHTGFPDLGWNIPELLMEYNIGHRVLFTYKCKNCGKVSTTFFNDNVCYCNECGTFNNSIAGPTNGVSDEELNSVYNIMDAYIQVSSHEGWGIPIVEAAASGLLVAAVYYSAMQSIIDNLDGIPIAVESFVKEASTGRNTAKPSLDSITNVIAFYAGAGREDLYNQGLEMAKNYRHIYKWENTINTWLEAVDNVRPPIYNWNDPIRTFHPSPLIKQPDILGQTNFLISNVMGKPEWLGGQLWRRLLKDLTYNTKVASYGDFYFNEMSQKDTLRQEPFSFEQAYKEIVELRNYYNTWEEHRVSTL